MNTFIGTGKGLRTAVVWAAVCLVIVLVGAGQAVAAAVEVDARSAHHAVWRVYGAGKAGGTAFAITDRHFLTCAHVIKYLSGHGAKEVVLDRHGSNDRRSLRVNWGHVALTLIQDIALFTTRETVDHSFALAEVGTKDGEIGLLAMGHPEGFPLETLRQTDPITYHNEFHLEVPVDGMTRGGLSGSPVFRDDGNVVGMHCQGSDNMSVAVRVEHLRRFLDGDLPWTACRGHPSVATCIERATRQVRELAAAGDQIAQYQLGRAAGHLDRDLAMLRRAAEGGFAQAQNSLGFSLKESEQWAEAARWFRRSAEQGHPVGWYQLGLAHYRGRGVARDRGRAFELILRAAHSGDASAEYGVGLLYQRGHGTARDVAKARRWFQRAADKGLEEARE